MCLNGIEDLDRFDGYSQAKYSTLVRDRYEASLSSPGWTGLNHFDLLRMMGATVMSPALSKVQYGH